MLQKGRSLTLGGRMRVALDRAGMSSEAMGRALDVAGGTVRGWTLDRREPDLASLRAFASHAGVSLLWLLEGDRAPSDLSEWALAYADLVASGTDPAAALGEVSAGAASVSAAESQALSAQAEGMRRLLDDLGPAPWRHLTLLQKREVLALVERLARENRVPATGERVMRRLSGRRRRPSGD